MNVQPSARLSFRLMTPDDAELLFQLDQDPEVMKYVANGVVTSREKIDSIFLPRMEAYRNPDKGWGLWQINVTNTNEFIGWILVRPMYFFSETPEFDNLELGWRFFQSTWGKGFATEAALHLKNHLAQHKSYRAFSAIADENNLASVSVMKKMGMRFVKSYLHTDPLFECQVVYYQIEN